MTDENKNMAQSLIEELWLRYTDKLFKNFDYDWISLQAMYSRYVVNKSKKL